MKTKNIGWTWLANRTSYNAKVRAHARGQTGVYAVRDSKTKEVLYVGESHTNRLWKTMLRHFQGQQSFANIGEWTHPSPETVQVKLWVTKTGDQAVELETEKVRQLAPHQVRGTADMPEDSRDDDEPAPF